MSPIRIYTNWNKRESSDREQIEPYRKYFFICEQDITLSTEMITSNIGNVIAGILDEKPI